MRPGELRRAEWSEIDLDRAEWRIPAVKMKGRGMHIVPLEKQAVRMLAELKPLTDRSAWAFPGVRTNGEPTSKNTINAALRRLGYDRTTLTAHGFRGMASTMLHEQGWASDVIERQLSHAERNSVKAAADSPPTTTAYALHHSMISDLVHEGLDLLTVAQVSGASAVMIECHYGHLRSEVAATALARLALSAQTATVR